MSILSKVNSALEEEGLCYVIERAPHFIRWRVQSKILDGVYRIYNPYGELTRSDMISHCEKNDQIWYYGTYDRFEIKPPITGPIPEPYEKLIGVQKSPKSFVCELTDVRLVGNRAIPQTKDGKFVLEEMGTNSMLKSRVMNTHASLNAREKFQEIYRSFFNISGNYDFGPLINLVPRHGAEHNNYVNYAHWMLEDLPRLRGYKHYCEQTGRKPQILLKKNIPYWMKNTLRLLGFSASDWTEWAGGSATVSRLVIPKLSYVHSAGAEIQPSDRKWVSEKMISNADTTNLTTERVFLSRQSQIRRKISNFKEVSRVLNEFDFEVVRPEELSIEDQIGLANAAEVIVGPSGAGFANMIFATDASILEIKPHGIYDDLWYILAQENDLKYSFVSSVSEGDNSMRNPESLRLDPEDLKQALEAIIKQIEHHKPE